MKLVVDLRRAFDSGLGTYIRHVVPASVAQLVDVEVVGLVAPGDQDKHRAYWGQTKVSFSPLAALPLGLAEQWDLRRTCANDAIFWATTLSHALLSSQRLVATVHDVLQLVLPPSDGVRPTVRWASHVYLTHLQHRAELLLFNSNFTAAEFSRHVGRAAGMTRVTPLGVHAAHWQSTDASAMAACAARTGGAPYFLWLGNRRPHKNLPLLLTAFEQVSADLPHHLVVAGRAARGTGPEEALASLPAHLQAKVHMLGEASAQSLPALMHGACALVMPSLYEGFGLPLLEACAAGCIVLASDIPAHREVGGDVPLYFEPRDTQALVQRMLQVARQSAAEKDARVNAGLARAQAMSWQHTASLTAAALQAVLTRRIGNVPARSVT